MRLQAQVVFGCAMGSVHAFGRMCYVAFLGVKRHQVEVAYNCILHLNKFDVPALHVNCATHVKMWVVKTKINWLQIIM